MLNGFEYWTILVGHFGLRAEPDVDADFLQIPFCENAEIANILLAHRQGRGMVPAGKGLLVAYARHEWSEARFDADADLVLDDMLRAIDKTIPGVSSLVEVRNLERWKPALFRSRVGSYRELAAFRRSMNPAAKVALAGDYFSFTSTNASALSGDAAARQLIAMDERQ
jgi:protoporphyrinogen oxidase